MIHLNAHDHAEWWSYDGVKMYLKKYKKIPLEHEWMRNSQQKASTHGTAVRECS